MLLTYIGLVDDQVLAYNASHLSDRKAIVLLSNLFDESCHKFYLQRDGD